MKSSKKAAIRYNEHKREFFIKRWFKKKKKTTSIITDTPVIPRSEFLMKAGLIAGAVPLVTFKAAEVLTLSVAATAVKFLMPLAAVRPPPRTGVRLDNRPPTR